MSKNTSLFQNEEEHEVLAIANAIGEKLDLQPGASIKKIIEQGEIELDLQRMHARALVRGIKALKALLSAKQRKEQVLSRAEQAHADMLAVADLLAEAEIQMDTVDIIESCACALGIPEERALFVIEMLALQGKIALGPDGWMIQGERAPAETIG